MSIPNSDGEGRERLADRTDVPEEDGAGPQIARWVGASAESWRRFAAELADAKTEARTQNSEFRRAFALVTVELRRQYRRYLRSRFGFDVVRLRWLRRARIPRSTREYGLMDGAIKMYAVVHNMWTDMGEPRRDSQVSAEQMLAGIGVLEDLPTMFGLVMSCPSLKAVHANNTVAVAGWMYGQLSLGRSPRLKASLDADGQAASQALRERLPGAVLLAWDGAKRQGSSLRATEMPGRVSRMLGQDEPLRRQQQRLIRDRERRRLKEIERAQAEGRLTDAEARERSLAVESNADQQVSAVHAELSNSDLRTEAPDPLEEFESREIALQLIDRARLTPREAELLDWHLQGLTNVEIAELLELSPNTVGRYLYNALHKLEQTVASA